MSGRLCSVPLAVVITIAFLINTEIGWVSALVRRCILGLSSCLLEPESKSTAIMLQSAGGMRARALHHGVRGTEKAANSLPHFCRE